MSEFNGAKFVRRIFGCKDRVTSDGRTLGEVVADLFQASASKPVTVWDAFAGSTYCGMVFKRRAMTVISSEIRPSAWLRAAALVGTNAPALTADKIEKIANAVSKADGWFRDNEALLIGKRNAGWLDTLHSSILPSLDQGERLAAVLGVTWAVETLLQRGSRFLHMHRSWHRETLCGGWHMRDSDLAAVWRRFMLEDYPRLMHDNAQVNPCLFGDAIELAAGIKADAAYFDVPYAGLFSSYKGFYDLVDDWPRVLLGADMPPEPAGQPHRRFTCPNNAIMSFALLMNRARHIPLWVISYSDSDTMRVTPEEIACLAESEGRSVEILRFPFKQSGSTKHDSPRSYNECLIVCRDGTKGGTAVPPQTIIDHSSGRSASDDGEASPVQEDAQTCVSLCSGVGGTDFALKMAGFRIVLACEKNDFARKAYQANFGHLPHPDVRTLELRDVPLHDLLSSGWPCQDISVGGLHKGMDADRCRLALEIVRIAKGARPKAILLENANTLPTFDNGNLLRDLLSRFAEIGYHGTWAILEASDFGMPCMRKRTYVVLFRDDLGITDFMFPKPYGGNSSIMDVLLPDRQTDHLVVRRSDVFIETVAVAKAEAERPQHTMRVGRVGHEVPARQGLRIYSPAGHAATICSGGGGLGANTGLYLINGKVRPLHPREAARALGFPDSFLLPDSEEQAMRLVGNSVAIPVVTLVAKAIAKKLEDNCSAGSSVPSFKTLSAYSDQVGHSVRRKSDTCSDSSRTPSPAKSDTSSERSDAGCLTVYDFEMPGVKDSSVRTASF